MSFRTFASKALQTTMPIFRKKFSNISTLYSTFITQQYGWLIKNLRENTLAIDIGANIGDSSIYLAQFPQIKKIIAYEPFPFLYEQAMANIALSGYDDKIELNNAGLSDILKKIKITEGMADIMSRVVENAKGREICILSLNDVLAQFKSANVSNVIIKCDAEGYEHKIFNESVNLDCVYKMQINYHFEAQKIPNILESKGFAYHKIPIEYQEGSGNMGWIFAWKGEKPKDTDKEAIRWSKRFSV